MVIKVSCTWGDGPDVLMNLNPSYQEQEGIMRTLNNNVILVDLTSVEARELAGDLMMSARQADELQTLAANHDTLAADHDAESEK